MNTWIDTLSHFSDAIRTGTVLSPGEIVCPRYAGDRGVEVYRNNYRGNLHDTLAGAYPVIRQLVGEDFFRLLARHFIERHDSHSGNLHRYGSEMAEFLTHFSNTQHLVYLPDMARLEWAYHRAYFADDAVPFDLARLAGVASGLYAGLRWHLHPGCALLVTAFPVSAIWQAHQSDTSSDFNIDLNDGGENLLVHRHGLSLEITEIAPDGHYWLSLLQSGKAMGVATEATLAIYPDFDLGASLHQWLELGVLVDFDIAMEEA